MSGVHLGNKLNLHPIKDQTPGMCSPDRKTFGSLIVFWVSITTTGCAFWPY